MANIVLIHGAYQGGWIWQRVVSRLAAAGHRVFAPSLDGCAERRHALRPGINTETHGAEIAELLFFEDLRDVVLVGTSSGGMVACKAAELARERIGRLVLADALALFDGECIGDIVKRPTRGDDGSHHRPVARGCGGADVRQPRRCDEGLGAGALYAASGGGDARSGEAAELLAAELEGERDLVPPGAESWRGASASRGGEARVRRGTSWTPGIIRC